MRKIAIWGVLALIALALAAVPALGATTDSATGTITGRTGGLHFTSNPTATATLQNNTSVLTATGNVAGAGTQVGTAVLSADVVVTRGCINRGSQGQEPSGLQRSFEDVTGTAPFTPTRQGRANFSVSTTPINVAGFSCPDRMTPVLVSVTYSNITLTLTSQTGSTTATFPDLTVTR